MQDGERKRGWREACRARVLSCHVTRQSALAHAAAEVHTAHPGAQDAWQVEMGDGRKTVRDGYGESNVAGTRAALVVALVTRRRAG